MSKKIFQIIDIVSCALCVTRTFIVYFISTGLYVYELHALVPHIMCNKNCILLKAPVSGKVVIPLLLFARMVVPPSR